MPGPKGEECQKCYFRGEAFGMDAKGEIAPCHLSQGPVMTGAAYWCREFKIHPDHQDDSEDSRKPCIDCKHSLFDRSTCDASGVDISKGRTEDGKPYCNIFQPVTCAECKAGGAWTNECLVSGHPITSNSPACSDFVRYDALESENQDDSDMKA
jgi:hypothetical protein